jgi:hypothetical protein
MLGEATAAALRGVAAYRAVAAAAAALLFLSPSARADPPPAYGWREVFAGADVSSHAWLLYSGATIAPYCDMFSNGLRLRATVGYGGYSYEGERNGEIRSFESETAFTDTLVGYLMRLGPLTAKAFLGASAIMHDVRPMDPQNPVQGLAYGPKGVAEFWLNMGNSAWSSLDVNWTSAHQTYSGRVRTGYRVFDDVSVGAEARVIGNALDKDARGGLFVRYAWEGGEVSFAGGVAGRFFEDAQDMRDPYATMTWLMQY